MESTTLGRGGPVVSRVGLGLMAMSGTYGPADDAESTAFDTHGYRPIALVNWRGFAIGGGEIDHRRNVLLAKKNDVTDGRA